MQWYEDVTYTSIQLVFCLFVCFLRTPVSRNKIDVIGAGSSFLCFTIFEPGIMIRPRGYRTFSFSTQAEYKIYPAHKC